MFEQIPGGLRFGYNRHMERNRLVCCEQVATPTLLIEQCGDPRQQSTLQRQDEKCSEIA